MGKSKIKINRFSDIMGDFESHIQNPINTSNENGSLSDEAIKKLICKTDYNKNSKSTYKGLTIGKQYNLTNYNYHGSLVPVFIDDDGFKVPYGEDNKCHFTESK